MHAFDFDYWKNLAASAPADFEANRRKVLMEAVAAAPEHQRPALQALVETLCAPQAGSPMERAVHAQNLMMESLVYLQQGLGDLLRTTGHSAPPSSTVMEFTELVVKKPGQA